MSKDILVIYHGKCIDGFTAAWVCWRKHGDQADYFPASYGSPPPDVAGKEVVIVDFSYKRDVMGQISREAKSVLVLDHHKTAVAELEGLSELDNVHVVFDMDRCGARMAWDHFFKTKERPWLIDYVEDRDLWRWDLPRSREVSAYISTVEQDFLEWTDNLLFKNVFDAADLGKGVLAYIDRYVREMCEQARLIRWEGYIVPVVNAPYPNISELCGELAKRPCPECGGKQWKIKCQGCNGTGQTAFALGWFQRGDGKYHYSLRSRGEFDVSTIARKYGGGGHKNAAGFVLYEWIKPLGRSGK